MPSVRIPTGPVTPITIPGGGQPPTTPTAPSPTIPSTASPIFVLPGAPGTPAIATFELHPSIGLAEEYSDNFNLSVRNRQENLRSSVSPGATLLINSAFTKGLINYNVSGSHDSSTDDLNFFQSLLGQVSWQASPRLTLTVSDTLTQSDEPSQADRLSLRQTRQKFVSNGFSLTAGYLIATIGTQAYYKLSTFFNDRGPETTSHTAGTLATIPLYQTNSATIGYEFLTSETSDGGTTDRHQFTASLSRQLNVFSSAGISATYALGEDTSQKSSVGSTFTEWSVSLFTSYAIPGRWSISSSIGYSQVDRGSSSPDSSVTTQTSLTYQFARATASLAVEQGFSETFAAGENFGLVETRGVTGSLSYPFTPLTSGTIIGFYRENKSTGVGGGQRTNEEAWGGSASLSIELLRWLHMALDYNHNVTSSSTGNFTENRGRISLSASF